MVTVVYFTHLEYPTYNRSVWLHDRNVDYLANKHIIVFLVAIPCLPLPFSPLHSPAALNLVSD